MKNEDKIAALLTLIMMIAVLVAIAFAGDGMDRI